MKQVFSSPNPEEAALVQSVLDAAQIECEMRNEAISQTFPLAFQPEVWVVKDSDYEEARRLIKESAAQVGTADAGTS